MEVWGILEDYYECGVFKSIGVSYFEQEHIDLILKKGKVRPVLNQIKSNAGSWNDELIRHNHRNGILTVAWGPLDGIEDKAKQVLEEIGSEYGKTAAQDHEHISAL